MVDTPVLPGHPLQVDGHEVVNVCYFCSGEVLAVRQILDVLKRKRDWHKANPCLPQPSTSSKPLTRRDL